MGGVTSGRKLEQERATERQANRAMIWILVIAVVAILLFWLVGYEAIFE